MKELDSQVLKGIRTALLASGSPQVSAIDRITSQKPTYECSGQRGSSIFSRYEVQVSDEEADDILDILVQLQERYGHAKVIEERQIGFLVHQWKRATEK
jgi:hypothetical protein